MNWLPWHTLTQNTNINVEKTRAKYSLSTLKLPKPCHRIWGQTRGSGCSSSAHCTRSPWGGQDRTAPILPDMYSVQHVFYECICIHHLYSLVSYHCECVEKKFGFYWGCRNQNRNATWGRGWMTKASGVGERRKGRGELRRDCHHRVAAWFVPTRMQQWYMIYDM